MSEDRDEQFVQSSRQRLQQTLANCNRLIDDAASAAQRRPDGTAGVAPDELVEAHTIQQRTIKALAALNAGEAIPQSPAA